MSRAWLALALLTGACADPESEEPAPPIASDDDDDDDDSQEDDDDADPSGNPSHDPAGSSTSGAGDDGTTGSATTDPGEVSTTDAETTADDDGEESSGDSGSGACADLEACCDAIGADLYAGCISVVNMASPDLCDSILSTYHTEGYCTGEPHCDDLADCCPELPPGVGWQDPCEYYADLGNQPQCLMLIGDYQLSDYCL